MRTMTTWGLLAALVLAPVAVRGDDGPEILTPAEWEARAKAETTIDLMALAGKVRVKEQGKILDISPDDGGATIFVCGVRGGDPKRAFPVEADQMHEIKGWKKWDRVSWLNDVIIESPEFIRFEPIYGGPRNLTRTPNPGLDWVEWTPNPTPRMEVWAKRYARQIERLAGTTWSGANNTSVRRLWARALEMIQDAQKEDWIVKCVVEDASEAERYGVLVRFPEDVFDVESHHVRLPEPDPQVFEALVPGTTVFVSVRVWTKATSPEALSRDPDPIVNFGRIVGIVPPEPEDE